MSTAPRKASQRTTTTPLDSARSWLRRGFYPIPVVHRSKAAVPKEWPSLRLTESDLGQYFNGRELNIGIILGDEHGSADVDLDCDEAIEAARILLPETGLIFGRRSRPASHYLYRSDPPLISTKYKDPLEPDKSENTIVELRCRTKDGTSTGMQTVVPPSTHATGEVIQFESGGDGLAANVEADDLNEAVGRVAAASLLGRHFPKPKGGRNDAFLALAGILARAGWKPDYAVAFNFAIYRVLFKGNADHESCSAEVKSTFDKYAAGGEITGIPKLKTLVDERVVKTVLHWLGINLNAGGAIATVDGTSVFDRIAPYPEPLRPAAYYGVAGKFVRLVDLHTEADPNLLLVTFLVYAGNVLGRNAFVWTGADKQYPNLFVCAVGPSANGRKGSAASPVKMFFQEVDPAWVTNNIQSGLSSGEGVIWAIHDPIFKKGKTGTMEEIDAGVSDKRLLVKQSEFFGALQAMKRQGNTLSSTIREAWDLEVLGTMVKNSPAKATNPHVSIVANITCEELLRGLFDDEMDNGFANRFLWICSKRSRYLPEGGRISDVNFDLLVKEFKKNRGVAQGAIGRDADASDMWGYDNKPGDGIYHHLSRDRGGIFGQVTARAAPQVLRISLIYALLDGSPEIRREHLEAAMEVWRYAEDSAAYIFGDAMGDPTADAILTELRRVGKSGRTRTELMACFGNNKTGAELTRGLMSLHRAGKARFERIATGGRPTERWFAA